MHRPEAWPAALAVFSVAALTDWLDGWWARRFNQRTPLGRSLDPLTDKVLVGAAFIYLIPVADAGIWPWMVAVVVCRELLVTGLRGDRRGDRQAVRRRLVRQAQDGVAVCGADRGVRDPVAARRPWSADALPALEAVHQVLLYAMLAATVGSMVQYIVKAVRLLR